MQQIIYLFFAPSPYKARALSAGMCFALSMTVVPAQSECVDPELLDCMPRQECQLNKDDRKCRRCNRIFGFKRCFNDPGCEAAKAAQNREFAVDKVQCEANKTKQKAACEAAKAALAAACK
jgi:hypothetical protein